MIPQLLSVLLMANAIVNVGLTDQAQRLIAEWRTVETRLVEALDAGFQQFVIEAAESIRTQELSGTAGSGSGGGTPVGSRSGGLRDSVVGVQTSTLGGFIGTTRGTTTPYARTILGPGTTTIRPVSATKLWIPIAANLTGRKVARYTPRALFDTFGDRVKIFTSKAGNTVVFVEEARGDNGAKPRYKRNSKGGAKGQLKGKLYFVLKDQVVIHGTNALAEGVERMGARGAEILTHHLVRAFPGGSASGGGGGAA